MLNGGWIAHSGTPWRDLPVRYGSWNSVYRRFRIWIEGGILDNIFQVLSLEAELYEFSLYAIPCYTKKKRRWRLWQDLRHTSLNSVTMKGLHFKKQSVTKTCRTVLKRCQILLELDEEQGTGLTHAQIAHSYAVCPATITNIVQSYVTNGIMDIVRYKISPNSSAALRKIDGRTEARIIQMACGPVPEGHSRWTLRLLEEKARVELDIPVGRETIRETLKKMNFDLTKTPTGASLPKKTQNL